jgi:hypothetical protein
VTPHPFVRSAASPARLPSSRTCCTIWRSRVSSARACVRKVVIQCNLTPALSPLRMQRRRMPPLRGAPTAPSLIEIQWHYPTPLDAPGGAFDVTEGSLRGDIDVAMRRAGDELPGISADGYAPALRGGILDLSDWRATGYRQFPPIRRSARRSRRPRCVRSPLYHVWGHGSGLRPTALTGCGKRFSSPTTFLTAGASFPTPEPSRRRHRRSSLEA